MPTVIIVIIVVIFFVSYIKFKRKYKIQFLFAEFMREKNNLVPKEIDTILSLCSAYTDAQLYKKAYDKYCEILNDPLLKETLSQDQLERVIQNRRFCDAPMFWSSGPRDHIFFKYIHYFFLNRIGRRRYNFIREEDVLEFNTAMRLNQMR